MTEPKPQPNDKAKQHSPRNPSDPTGGKRQELDPKKGSQEEGEGKRDSFSGETMPRH